MPHAFPEEVRHAICTAGHTDAVDLVLPVAVTAHQLSALGPPFNYYGLDVPPNLTL